VLRSFVDSREQTWLEVDAASYEGGQETDDDKPVVTIPLAVVRLSKSLAEGAC
jgi:hypothetical protein